MNSQPVGYVNDDLGYASVYEHFALQMTELRKAQLRRAKDATQAGATDPAP